MNDLPPLESRRLIIVEDEGILALDIERHLRARGFEVAGVAADAASAEALVAQHRPDLVLMDIRIQGELDGIETARLLRERFDVPVVFLTAQSDAATIERANSTAPLGYLLKPFKKPDLENVVGIALRRSQAERALRQREALLASTLECIDEAVLTASEGGVVTWANAAAAELARCAPRELVDRPLDAALELRTKGGALRELLDHAKRVGRTRIEAELVWPHETRTLVGVAAPLGEAARQGGYVVALRDLSEFLRARAQVEFTERLATVGTLAAGVAHEVNNPLSVITSCLDFLAGEAQGEAVEAIADARDAAQRVARIVSDLLAFSSPQVELVEPLTLASCVRTALRLTRAKWGPICGVTLELDPCPPVQGTAVRLAQVAVCLVINAAQAMRKADLPGQGALLVRTATADDGAALLMVSDSGPGVPPTLRERIFDPFFTTKAAGEGTGLGLAVARSIARNHGGELTCGPRPDGHQGACFTLKVPAATASPVLSLRTAWVGAADQRLEALREHGEVTQLQANDPELRQKVLALDVDLVIVADRPALAAVAREGVVAASMLWLSDDAPATLPAGVLELQRASHDALRAFAGRVTP